MEELSDLACHLYFYIYMVDDPVIKRKTQAQECIDRLCEVFPDDRQAIKKALKELIDNGMLRYKAVN